MKKTIFILILILVAVYAVLSILGAGDEYAAERLFYRAAKANEKILINPEVAPPKLLESVEKKFKKVVERYPDTDAAKRAHMALAEFYLANKKYDEALSTLDAVIETKDQGVPILSKAHFFKAAIYEKQDQWNKAVDEYTMLKDRYFNTSIGLTVPLYLGRCYAKKGDGAKADRAYSDAVLFYEQLGINKKGKVVGYAASDLLMKAYMDLGKYEAAGKVVEDTLNNYPSKQTFINYLPLVESIYAKRLGRPTKAIEIYSNLMEKAEDNKLKEFLQGRIEELQGKSQE